MNCDEIDNLLATYAVGEYPETSEEHRAVTEHLAGCAACREKLADIRATVSLLAMAGAQGAEPALSEAWRAELRQKVAAATAAAHTPASIPFSFPWRGLGIAASVGLLTVAGIGVFLPSLSRARYPLSYNYRDGAASGGQPYTRDAQGREALSYERQPETPTLELGDESGPGWNFRNAPKSAERLRGLVNDPAGRTGAALDSFANHEEGRRQLEANGATRGFDSGGVVADRSASLDDRLSDAERKPATKAPGIQQPAKTGRGGVFGGSGGGGANEQSAAMAGKPADGRDMKRAEPTAEYFSRAKPQNSLAAAKEKDAIAGGVAGPGQPPRPVTVTAAPAPAGAAAPPAAPAPVPGALPVPAAGAPSPSLPVETPAPARSVRKTPVDSTKSAGDANDLSFKPTSPASEPKVRTGVESKLGAIEETTVAKGKGAAVDPADKAKFLNNRATEQQQVAQAQSDAPVTNGESLARASLKQELRGDMKKADVLQKAFDGDTDGVANAKPGDIPALAHSRRQLEEAEKSREPADAAAEGIADGKLPASSLFKVMPVNPWVMTTQDHFSTFAMNVDTASYALARRYVHAGYRPPAGAVRMEEFINSFDYNYPSTGEHTFTVHAQAAPAPFGGEGGPLTLVKIGVKAKSVGREGRKAAHLVFVVDASGSMEQRDRMPLVKYAINQLAGQLADADRITIITYNSTANLLLENASTKDANGQAVSSSLEAIQTGGSTNLLEGLRLGYEQARSHFVSGGINRVVLCSDGVANVGESDAKAILGKVAGYKKDGITLTTAGFGLGAYNDSMMEQLADKGDGNYVFIDSETEARRVFVEQLSATLQTVAKDAKIQVEFDPAVVRRYRLIGYENRAIKDEDFRNDAVEAAAVGSGQSATALYEVELLPFADAAKQPDLGTVFVRWKDVESEKVEEISYRLAGSIVAARTPADSPRFYLAAAAAEFAELLRNSEHAQGGSLEAVENLLAQVTPQVPLDKQAAELLELVRSAKGLPVAP
jgi:Ca-activated chloride channel family protein